MNFGGFLFALILTVAGVLILFWAIGKKGKMDTASQLARWRELYRREFGVEFGEVVIPKRRRGFNRLIVVVPGVTMGNVVAALRKRFSVVSVYGDLNGMFFRSERGSTVTYAFWVRNRVEADRENAKESANDIKVAKLTTMTLIERLLYELMYFTETGWHLDVQYMTLCAGSRYSYDVVPTVWWHELSSALYVNGLDPDNSFGGFRARTVVSLPAEASAQVG